MNNDQQPNETTTNTCSRSKRTPTIKTRFIHPSSKQPPIQGIYGHAMCIRHETNTLYVYGGWIHGGSKTNTLMSACLDSIQMEDENNCHTINWTIIEQKGDRKPGPCSFASLSELNGNLILFGGYFTKWVNDLWIFNLETCEWKKITPKSPIIPPPRAAHSCNIPRSKLEMIVHAGVSYFDC
jgi:hypothetical protein